MRFTLGVVGVVFVWLVGWAIQAVVFWWWLLDIALEVLTGSRQLPGGDMVVRLFRWQTRNTAYVLLNRGSWQWTP